MTRGGNRNHKHHVAEVLASGLLWRSRSHTTTTCQTKALRTDGQNKEILAQPRLQEAEVLRLHVLLLPNQALYDTIPERTTQTRKSASRRERDRE